MGELRVANAAAIWPAVPPIRFGGEQVDWGSMRRPGLNCMSVSARRILFSHASMNQRICGRLKAPEMESRAPLLASMAASAADMTALPSQSIEKVLD